MGYVAYKDKQVKKDVEKARASEKRRALNEYKISVGCFGCGYNSHWAALEFDHLPEFQKSRTVASLCYASWDAIWQEIAKCDVVCSNCHSIRTVQRLGLSE